MVSQVQEVDTPDHQWQSRHRELYHGHGSSCGWPQLAGPGWPEWQKDKWVNMAHIHFQTMSPQFLRMRRKPNSWLPRSEWHVEKPCWKLNLCTKNRTLRHTASSVAPSDESECRKQLWSAPPLSFPSQPLNLVHLVSNQWFSMLFVEWRFCCTEQVTNNLKEQVT